MAILPALVAWGTLAGCVRYVEGPGPGGIAYAPPQVAYVESQVVVPEPYIYYPGYQVYYNGSSRHYIYREGRSWVSRPAPPRVAVDVLVASPSVRLNFYDSPANHHTAVVRQYPRRWRPPESSGQSGRNGSRDFRRRE